MTSPKKKEYRQNSVGVWGGGGVLLGWGGVVGVVFWGGCV